MISYEERMKNKKLDEWLGDYDLRAYEDEEGGLAQDEEY